MVPPADVRGGRDDRYRRDGRDGGDGKNGRTTGRNGKKKMGKPNRDESKILGIFDIGRGEGEGDEKDRRV